MTSTLPPLTVDVLKQQDDRTSEAVLALLAGSDAFAALSAREGAEIIQRDREDDTKLAVGIQISVAKGALPALEGEALAAVTARQISVVGKTADAVAQEILSSLPGDSGNVIVLQGLSGTGKGTTVKKLQAALPRCVCWSNGNVFRTFTHLCSEQLAASGIDFAAAALTPELIAGVVQRVTFAKVDGTDDEYDVFIDGTTRVGPIANTTLKMPHISARVPTVAEHTQGEVIKFAAGAVEALRASGRNVILEGRAQTLQYMPTPHRFELVIADTATLGARRAAQRVMAKAVELLASGECSDAAAAVLAAVEKL